MRTSSPHQEPGPRAKIQSRRTRILIVVLLSGVGACGSDEPADDRPPAPPSYLKVCNDDTDCTDDLICAAPILLEEVCTLPCGSDSDCPRDSDCFDRGYCDSVR